jgi:hypothetical protein
MIKFQLDNAEKIFTKKSILFATFLGGPLVAGFLIYKNYKVFGKYETAQKSLIIGIVCTIALLSVIFLIPGNTLDKLPNHLIPFVYTGILALIINKYQDKLINEYLERGGPKASGWVAAGYGFVSLIILLLFMIPIAISLPQSGYEKESKIYEKVLLHSSKKLDIKISEKIIGAIRQTEYLDVNQESDLFLNEENNQYILKFVLLDFASLSDSIFLHDFNLFENILNSEAHLDKKIKIGFTNPLLTQTKDLPYVSVPEQEISNETPEPYNELSKLQRYQINLSQSIYYNSTMPLSDVKIVAESIRKLKTYFPENQPLDLIFTNNGDFYITKFFVNPASWDNFPNKDRLKSTIGYFKNAGVKKEIKIVIINGLDFREKEI